MNLEIITLEEINKLTPLEAFEAGVKGGRKEAELFIDDAWNGGYKTGYKAGYRDCRSGNEYDHSLEG